MSIVDINASIVDRYLEGLGRQFFPSRLLPDKASGLRQIVEMLSQQGLYAQTLENSVKLDFRLPQSGAALAC
jgi:hypothetical protein